MKNILFLTLLLSGVLNAQHKLSGKFSPQGAYQFAFLYKATPNGANFIDRAKLDANGTFSMELDSTLSPGIYKVVYAIPPEDNNFDIIYNTKESIHFTFNADTGIVFTESSENKLLMSYMKSMGMINQTISNYYQQDGKDEKAFNDIFKTLSDTQKAYESSAKGMLALDLIKANHPYIPAAYEDLSSYSKNLKKTYFDHIDFDNAFLQSTSFITDRINGYLFQVADTSTNEDYKSRVDDIAKAIASSAQETQLGIFLLLWNEFIQLNNDALTSYVGNTYLSKVAKDNNQTEVLAKVEAQERIAIGAKAPNFLISQENSTSYLHELPNNQEYLLIFWSSGCSHCMKELPLIHKLLKDQPNIKVIAYGLEDNRAQWEAAIATLEDFIHVYGPKKWDNPIVSQYSLRATPTYFLLASDKTIKAKPYDYQAVEALFKDQ
jgi:thiol-disulfide isomerase/thioredoxin